MIDFQSTFLTAYAHTRIIATMSNTPALHDDERLIQASRILSALAEPTRLAALRIIWDGRESCVCELMRDLSATQSRMSRHMNALKIAGLVTDRRDAQWVRYRRAPNLAPEVVALVDAALAVVHTRERTEA